MTVTKLVDQYLTELQVGQIFGPRDLCNYIYMKSMGDRQPLDGTVMRMVREWRAKNPTYDIECCDPAKALYKKIKKTS